MLFFFASFYPSVSGYNLLDMNTLPRFKLGVTIKFNQRAICSFGVIFDVSMFGKLSPVLDKLFFSHNTTSLNCGTIGQLNGTTRSELQWKIFGLDRKFCHQIFHYLWCEIDDVSIFISTIDSTFEKFIRHLIK